MICRMPSALSQLRIGLLNEPTALAAGLPDASAFGSFQESRFAKALADPVVIGGEGMIDGRLPRSRRRVRPRGRMPRGTVAGNLMSRSGL
jgi:hypothetical protein